MKKIKAVIFDLDNCLAPADPANGAAFGPVFEAIAGANNGFLSPQALAAAFAEFWRVPLDIIEERHRFSPEMKSAARAAYRQLRVTSPMSGYPDLPLLAEFRTAKFLVTTGFRRLQESKIEMLGIAREFEAVHIDEIDAIDDSGRKGKIGLFSEILKKNRLDPEKALVVGDNPDSEIDAGNRLGIPTVQILRPGIIPGGNAAFYVRNLAELLEMVVDRSGPKAAPGNGPALPGFLRRFGEMRFPPAPFV